jgi:O-antigen/teichoic acid export membrane protein
MTNELIQRRISQQSMPLTERVQTIVMGFGQLMSSLIALVFLAILARTVASNELGIYLYYMAFAGAVEGLSDIGLRLRGVSALSAAISLQQRAEIMGALWRLKLTLSLALVGLVVMLSAIGGLRGRPRCAGGRDASVVQPIRLGIAGCWSAMV